MVTRAIDVQESLIGGVAHAAGGALQRLAWEKEQTGFMTTGAFVIGGLLLKSMAPRGIMATLGEAAFNSGATIAGWVGAERVFQLGGGAAGGGGLALRGGRNARGFLGSGRQRVMANGYSNPGVALMGMNPNTGEQILGSGI